MTKPTVGTKCSVPLAHTSVVTDPRVKGSTKESYVFRALRRLETKTGESSKVDQGVKKSNSSLVSPRPEVIPEVAIRGRHKHPIVDLKETYGWILAEALEVGVDLEGAVLQEIFEAQLQPKMKLIAELGRDKAMSIAENEFY